MPETMQVEVVSPERVLYSGEATMVITRTLGGGEIAFLPDHAPFLAALTENHTRINTEGGNTVHVAVHGGFVEVSHNKVSLLSDVAELGETIDVGRDADDAVDFYAATFGASLPDDVATRASAELRHALEPFATPDGVLLPASAWLVTARRDARTISRQFNVVPRHQTSVKRRARAS